MNFLSITNLPDILLSTEWRKKSFDSETTRGKNDKGIYIITLKLEAFFNDDNRPNFIDNANFYPLYVGKGWFRNRLAEHKKRPVFSGIHNKLDFWFLPLNKKTDSELKGLESKLINALNPSINVKDEKNESRKYDKEEEEEKRYGLLDIHLLDYRDIVIKLLRNGESESIEFKETFAYNTHSKQNDDRLKDECVKTIAAFLNSRGGQILIGIEDETRNIMGLERDLKHIYGNSIDRLIGGIKDAYQKRLDKIIATYIKISIFNEEVLNEIEPGNNKILIHINVKKSPTRKIYFKENNTEHFYIRTAHGEEKLLPSQIDEYWKLRN